MIYFCEYIGMVEEIQSAESLLQGLAELQASGKGILVMINTYQLN
jgi:hypothetical protein